MDLHSSLEQLVEAIRNSLDENVDAQVKAWLRLKEAYDDHAKTSNEAHSFQVWALLSIDADTLERICRVLFTADRSILLPKKASALSTFAKTFNTTEWIGYFVLGRNTVESRQTVQRISSIIKDWGEQTIVELLEKLEASRQKKRRLNRSRYSSNDLNKFTMEDVNDAFPRPTSNNAASRSLLRQDATLKSLPSNPPKLRQRRKTELFPDFEGDHAGASQPDFEDNGEDYLYNAHSPELARHVGRRLSDTREENTLEDSDEDYDRYNAHSPELAGHVGRRLSDIREENTFEDSDEDYDRYNAHSPELARYVERSLGDIREDIFIEEGDTACRSFKFDFEQLKDQWGRDGGLDAGGRIASPKLKDLIKLVGEQELNDEIINYYLKRVIDASKRNEEIISFTTQFFSTLDSRGSKYGNVRNWNVNLRSAILKKAQYLVIPVHDRTINHWVLVLAANNSPGQSLLGSGQSSTIYVVDSFHQSQEDKRIGAEIRAYLSHMAKEQLGFNFDESQISIELPQNGLRQKLGDVINCGLYLIEHVQRFVKRPREFLECLRTGQSLEPEFEPKRLREEMTINILQDKKAQDATGIEKPLGFHASGAKTGSCAQKINGKDSAQKEIIQQEPGERSEDPDRNEVSPKRPPPQAKRKLSTTEEDRAYQKSRRLSDVPPQEEVQKYGTMLRNMRTVCAEYVELSPKEMILEVAAKKGLMDLREFEFPEDLRRADQVEASTWHLLLENTCRDDGMIRPIQDLGFPKLEDALRPHSGMLTSASCVGGVITVDKASTTHGLPPEATNPDRAFRVDYALILAVDRAIMSSQTVRELSRRCKSAMQNFQGSVEVGLDRLSISQPISAFILRKGHEDMGALIKTLDSVFEYVEQMLCRLKEYKKTIQNHTNTAL
ncbi:hypothetical protein VE03_10226 [Pseudogymnoascus sp. 23342-1-I1]|nr:hypothetical protein VE03_10226 [Pseudogymnoascus sp. 23342-1-I1]